MNAITKVITKLRYDGLRPFFLLAQARRQAKAYSKDAEATRHARRSERFKKFMESADIEDGNVTVPVLDFKMKLPASDAGISRDLILDGVREANAVELVRELLPRIGGGVYFDVGANLGFFVLIEGTYSDDKLKRIYAFEPLPSNVAMLRSNIALNGMEDCVTVNECAMSDKEGRSTFQQEGHSNLGHLDEFESLLPEDSTSIEVRLDTIDAFCEREGVASINFLRMDVEGHEDLVLLGAKGILSKSKECLIFLEMHAWLIEKSGREPIRMLESLRDLGYRCVAICGRDNKQVEDFEWDFVMRSINVLCGCYGYHWFFARGSIRK